MTTFLANWTMLGEGRMDRALKAFTLAYSNFKNDKFPTSLGLADYYAKSNDKKNEVKYLKEAISLAPKDQATTLAGLNDRLARLNAK